MAGEIINKYAETIKESFEAEFKREIDEVKRRWKKDNRLQQDIFIEEVVFKEPEWAKQRRIEFLREKLKELNEDWVESYGLEAEFWKEITNPLIIEWKNTHPWEYRKPEIVKDGRELIRLVPNKERIEKEILAVKLELSMWENPKQLSNSQREDRITEQDIENAKNIDCGDFIEIRKGSGNLRWATCPFHDDSHPSLTIYPAGKGYHCFSCGAGGDTISLVMKVNNIDFKSAVKFILRK